MDIKFRHEYKFTLSPGDYLGVRMGLRAALDHDPHAGPSGEYFIRSVYFDNAQDKALREKLIGVNTREKFRIRYYNGDPTFIALEKKSKQNGLCNKIGCMLSAQEANRIFHGDTAWMRDSQRAVATELYAKMKSQQLRPKVIVDYYREPFVFPAGNARVTLDRDIRAGGFFPGLLENQAVTLPAVRGVLLEVKYDQFLPEFIRDIVQLGERQAGAFSKYAACRLARI